MTQTRPAGVAVDPELVPLLPPTGDPEAPRTWRRIREDVAAGMAAIGREVRTTGVRRSTLAAREGEPGLDWFEPRERSSPAAVVYVHGGGMVAGGVELFAPFAARYAATSGVPLLAVDYGLAPQTTGTAPAEQVAAALERLVGDASRLGTDPGRIALLGESAGGGLAAGAAILARDRGIPLRAQLLVQPMLDDRVTTPDPHLVGRLTWTYADDAVGWTALLGSHPGPAGTSPVAAPARLRRFEGLAPAFIEVGAAEIYRDPAIAYAGRLIDGGVPTELRVVPGAVHAFDQLAPHARITERVLEQRASLLRAL